MAMIHWLSNMIFKLEKFIVIILGLVMLFSLAAGVVYRYVLKSPLVWSDEVAIFSLIWLTFIGGSMSVKLGRTAVVTIFVDKFTGKVKKFLLGLSVLIVLVFAVYLLYLSLQWLSSPNILVQRSNSMNMPMIYAYLSVPVSFLFIAIHAVDLLARHFRQETEGV